MEIHERQKQKIRFTEKGKFIFTSNYWMNIDKPNQRCVLHLNGCLYEKKKKQTKLKGIRILKKDGGWLNFDSVKEAEKYFKKTWKKRGYKYQKGCQRCSII